jgi:alcohol dehydrogenase
MNFNYFLPTRILFGNGRLKDIAQFGLPGKKALLVISNGKSMKNLGYVDRVIKLMNDAGVEVVLYDGVEPNPTIDNVMHGQRKCLDNKCDFVIGLGGGSTIDCAKAIAVMSKNEGHIWDYIVGTKDGTKRTMVNGALPIVAITTTAGTGSEADPWTVTTNPETNLKLGFGGPPTFPTLSVVDPELMISVPPVLTAYQGFDALFHCMEAYYGIAGNKISAAYAQLGIENVGRYLKRAVMDGKDMAAREGMAFANLMGGFTLSTCGTSGEHAISQAVGGYAHDLPHGASLILISEAYFTFFAKRGVQSLVDIGRMLGEDVDALPLVERPMSAVYALGRFRRECGVDKIKLSDWGIKPEQFPEIAAVAKRTSIGLFKRDPIMLEETDIVQILKDSYK